MNNVALIGASGFIGRHLLNLLKGEGIHISALCRSEKSEEFFNNSGINYIKGDIYDCNTLDILFNEVDVVVILSHINDSDNCTVLIKNIVRTCVNKKVKRIIYCSSAVVVGDVKDDVITELTKCRPIEKYEKEKLNVENLFEEICRNRVELVVLRPTAVVGIGGKNLVKMTKSILYGNKILNYFKSSLNRDRRMNLVCVENVTSAILFLIKSNNYFNGEIFIISDDDCKFNNYRDIEGYLLSYLYNKKTVIPRIPIPRPIFKMILFLKYKRVVNTKRVYSSKKLESLGYVKPVELLLGLRVFVDWVKNI